MNKIDVMFFTLCSVAIVGIIGLGFYMVSSSNSANMEIAKLYNSCSK